MRELYEYNRWANRRTLDAVSRLSAEEFTRDLGNSFPSIRDTLVHIMWAEWRWVRRWKGESPKETLDPMEFPTLASLMERWADVESEQADFVSDLTDAALDERIAYFDTAGERWEYPLRQMVRHVVNHSTYHRGQVTTMLRQLGAEPVQTDLLLMYDLKDDSP